jgi:hypothetical protein
MNNVESLVVGVISGIITATIIQMLIILTNQVLLPWYRQLVYRGVNIQGKWEYNLDFNNGNTQLLTLELSQKAHAITGSVTMVKSKNGEIVRTEIMKLTGSVKDRLFNGTIVPTDTKRIGISTILLEIVGDGSKMSGCTMWYDSTAAGIHSMTTILIRL